MSPTAAWRGTVVARSRRSETPAKTRHEPPQRASPRHEPPLLVITHGLSWLPCSSVRRNIVLRRTDEHGSQDRCTSAPVRRAGAPPRSVRCARPAAPRSRARPGSGDAPALAPLAPLAPPRSPHATQPTRVRTAVRARHRCCAGDASGPPPGRRWVRRRSSPLQIEDESCRCGKVHRPIQHGNSHRRPFCRSRIPPRSDEARQLSASIREARQPSPSVCVPSQPILHPHAAAKSPSEGGKVHLQSAPSI